MYRSQASTPLIYNGVIYIPNRGDFIQAFDGATGEALWEYQREFPEGIRGSTNRNMAIYGTNLIDSVRCHHHRKFNDCREYEPVSSGSRPRRARQQGIRVRIAVVRAAGFTR